MFHASYSRNNAHKNKNHCNKKRGNSKKINKKQRKNTQGNKKRRSRYTEVIVERTLSEIRNIAWTSIYTAASVECTLSR